MKRLLFFPGHRILAYEWERGAFRRTEAFEPDEAGRAAFRAWLEEAPRTPVQLLLDVIEEEFHTDRIPHVIGRDRRELYRRTAERHFRSTEFRYIIDQGRESEGRRDDRVLVAGLTNPELLKTWLSVIDDTRVPLKGIHSLPLVGEALLPAIGAAKTARALVISQQIPSTLRQSYHERGQLRFSRLAPGRYSDAEGFAAFVQRELDQTLHFLETQRFRRQGAPIDVYILVNNDAWQALRERLSSSDTVTCHLVPLERVAKRVGEHGALAGATEPRRDSRLLAGFGVAAESEPPSSSERVRRERRADDERERERGPDPAVPESDGDGEEGRRPREKRSDGRERGHGDPEPEGVRGEPAEPRERRLGGDRERERRQRRDDDPRDRVPTDRPPAIHALASIGGR
jgi:hypothetical protein